MEKQPEGRQDSDALVVVLLVVVTLSVALIATLVLSGTLPNTSAQLLVETTIGIASLTIALATVRIYLQQNKIIDEQNRATVQAQKASIQTLDMAATDSSQDLIVEVSNSGGGAARDLRGKVKFDVPDSYGIDIQPYTAKAKRKASTRDRSEGRTWLASKGSTIAADEEQVPFEIQCAVELPGEDRALAFSAAVKRFARYWCTEQLSRIESSLSPDELEAIGERWGEEVFFDMIDASRTVDPDTIEMSDLNRIVTTLADSDREFDETDTLEDDVRLQIYIQYVDEYLESIGRDATTEVPVLDATFPADRGTEFKEIFENDYRTERREKDPEGSSLRI